MARNRNYSSGLGRGASRVGVDTTTTRSIRKGSGSNTPATKYWHQGFGVIRQGGLDIVPFILRETAERIAAQATRNTKIGTRVIAIDDGTWGYARLFEEES